MAEERKCAVFEFDRKLKIIKRVRKSKTATSIAQIFGVGRTTVYDFERNAEKSE